MDFASERLGENNIDFKVVEKPLFKIIFNENSQLKIFKKMI